MTVLSDTTAQHLQEHHRNIQGGAARAAVFGVSDGLVSNVSLILGMAGAEVTTSVVRLAGIAGLIAGAVSMAAGEFVSMRAQQELFERELEMERAEQEKHPKEETAELAEIYESRGVAPELAKQLAEEMSRTPELMLETHAREELGIDPNELGSPIQAAVSSFVAFAIGAFLPLIPWLFGTDVDAAAMQSVVIGAVAALGVGALLAQFTGRAYWFSALRQLAIATVAAGVTYFVGMLVGTGAAVG